MADHERIVALAFGAHGVADHLARAAKLHDGVRVAVVWRYALDVNRGAGIDNLIEMRAQPVPVGLAVVVVDEALIPDPHRIAHGPPTQRVPSSTGPRPRRMWGAKTPAR